VPIIARSVGLLSQCPRVISQAIAQVIGERRHLAPSFSPKSRRVGDRLGHPVAVMPVMMCIALLVAFLCLWCGSCGLGFFRRFAVLGKPFHFGFKFRVPCRDLFRQLLYRRSRSNASSSMLSESRSILAILTSCFALATGKVCATRTGRTSSTADNYRVRFR